MTVDLGLVVLLFAIMFKYLPDVQVRWRDVIVGAAMTALLFLIGKWALGLYLGSGAAGSAYGAASSLVTLLLWIYYSSQILLFGAEFTQVYANRFGAGGKPSKHAVCIADDGKGNLHAGRGADSADAGAGESRAEPRKRRSE